MKENVFIKLRRVVASNSLKTFFEMNLYIFSLLFLLFPSHLIAREKRKHEIRAKAGVTSNVEVILGGSYQLMFNNYAGISGGADVYHLLLKETQFIGGSRFDKLVLGEVNQTTNLLFNFSGILKFPLLRQQNETVFYMHFEPGLSLNPAPNDFIKVASFSGSPAVFPTAWQTYHNHGGKWLNYFFNHYISIDLDNFQIYLGYSYSNYDCYGGKRNIVVGNIPYNDLLPKKKSTCSLFASIGFYF